MEIKKITYDEVESEFKNIKPDLLDKHATYYGCFIKTELVGIVSYVEHHSVIYLCHAFVKEAHRNKVSINYFGTTVIQKSRKQIKQYTLTAIQIA